MEHKRNQTFQYLSVIGIISVIMGHVDLDTFPLMNTWFTPYSYHMALFVFISGYFYKSKNSESVNSAVAYTVKKIKTLLIPLFIWNLIYGGIVYLLSFKEFTIGEKPNIYNLFVAPFIDGPVFVYNMCGWFVMPLFLVEMIFVWTGFIAGKLKLITGSEAKKKITISITTVFLFAMGMLGIDMAIIEMHSPLQLLYIKTSFFAVFFMVGQLYKRYFEKYINKISNVIYFGVILFVQLCILHFSTGRLDYVISNGKQFENGVVIPFVTAITGILFYIRIAEILAKGIGESKITDVICRNGYDIMMHQFAGFMVVKAMIGLCQKFFGIFSDFGIPVMKVNIWYYYFPNNTAGFGIVYILGGLIIPIAIGESMKYVKRLLKNRVFKK